MKKKICGLIKRHKILFTFCIIALIVFIILIVAFLKMTVNTSSKYGDRLDGIESVEISKNTLSDIASKLEDKDEVSTASLRVQGKIIYVDISFTDSTSLAKAKEISASVISEFDDAENEFYDFSFIIKQVSENDDETWSSAGAKNSKDDDISWTRG